MPSLTKLIGIVFLALCCLGSAKKEDNPLRVLYFTKSSGFEHSVVKRGGDHLSHSEQILSEVFERNGIELVCSKDGIIRR